MAVQRYGVNFNGRRITHPGAYDAIDASGMQVVTEGSSNIPIVVGTANAGESGKVMWFTSADDARAYLRGGDLPTALDMMFSPAPEGGGGASLVGVIVTSVTTQAEVVKPGLKAKAREYGEGGNRVQVKLENGTITGSKKFTAYRWDIDQLETFDNLGALLTVQFTGTQAYAGLTVASTDGKATKLEVKIGADVATAVVDVSLDLTNERYDTIEKIAKHLNSLSGYNVTYVDYSGTASLPSSILDAVTTASNIKTTKTLMGVNGDLLSKINTESALVSIETSVGNLANFDYAYLQGGTKGAAPASWTPFFDTIKKQFSDILVVLSDQESIHAEALAHVQQMENRQQKQLLFTGGAVGETIARTKQRASVLNSSRAVLAFPGIYHKSVESGKKALPPYFTAAMIAGRVCGVDASEPITFDYFNLVALEKELLAGDPEVDELLNGGVAVLEKVQNGGIRLVQGITTYIGSNNTLYREISVRRGADLLSETMRSAMEETFVGKKGLRSTASAVTTKAIDVLDQAIKDGHITGYQNIVVRFVGTVVYVDYEVAPVEPINFILITSHFVPDSTIVSTEQQ